MKIDESFDFSKNNDFKNEILEKIYEDDKLYYYKSAEDIIALGYVKEELDSKINEYKKKGATKPQKAKHKEEGSGEKGGKVEDKKVSSGSRGCCCKLCC